MRTIRNSLAVLFVIAFVLIAFPAVLFASDEDDVTGRYDAVSCVQGGTQYQCDGEYIQLDKNGKGEIQFNGNVYSITWELDGSTFSFTDEDEESVKGTLEGGVIQVEYLDYEYVYTKNETSLGGSIDDAPEASQDALTSADADKEPQITTDVQHSSDSGSTTAGGPVVFAVTGREETGSQNGEAEGHPTWRYDYIALNEDGTGIFLFNKSAFSIHWTLDGNNFTFTDHKGNQFRGTMNGSTITGEYGRYRYTFEAVNQTLPCDSLCPDMWEKDLPNVVDEAGVLSDNQVTEFTRRAKELSEKYGVGVYVVLVDRLGNYTWCGDITTLSEELRAGYNIGIGATEEKTKLGHNTSEDWKDALILTVATGDRRYDISAYGDFGYWAFPDYGREKVRDTFFDELKGNQWADSVDEYLDGAEVVLKVAAKGKQISFRNDTTGRLIGFLVPAALALLFGYGITAIKKSSMQNTQKAKNAATYVAGDKVNFTRREDRYIRTLVSRTYSPRQKSSGGSGGGSFTSSSGGGHTSGSF